MYKNKYMIGLYGKDDETLGLFESTKELADYLGTTAHKVADMLSHKKNGGSIRANGHLAEVALIDMGEERR